MENSLEQKLIEALEREVRTLRELISAKDALITELQKHQPTYPVYPSYPIQPWSPTIPLQPINPWLPAQPYIITSSTANYRPPTPLDSDLRPWTNDTSHITEKFSKSN